MYPPVPSLSPPFTCTQRYGASTLVLDNRIFVSFNPFDVYVTQADVKPGCVLRAANVVQALQGRGLLTDEEVRASKKGKGWEEWGAFNCHMGWGGWRRGGGGSEGGRTARLTRMNNAVALTSFSSSLLCCR